MGGFSLTYEILMMTCRDGIAKSLPTSAALLGITFRPRNGLHACAICHQPLLKRPKVKAHGFLGLLGLAQALLFAVLQRFWVRGLARYRLISCQ